MTKLGYYPDDKPLTLNSMIEQLKNKNQSLLKENTDLKITIAELQAENRQLVVRLQQSRK